MTPRLASLVEQARAAGSTVVLVRTIWDEPYCGEVLKSADVAQVWQDQPVRARG